MEQVSNIYYISCERRYTFCHLFVDTDLSEIKITNSFGENSFFFCSIEMVTTV
jgi:hypothetical protein